MILLVKRKSGRDYQGKNPAERVQFAEKIPYPEIFRTRAKF